MKINFHEIDGKWALPSNFTSEEMVTHVVVNYVQLHEIVAKYHIGIDQ